MSVKCLISIGSNVSADINDATSLIQKCRLKLSQILNSPLEMSRIFRTPAFPAGAGPDFANAAFAVTSQSDSFQLLKTLHQLEADFGRTRTKRWGQRTLDLDLLAVGDQVSPDRATWEKWHQLPLETQMEEAPEELILPHPRIADRSFVLVPLADIAPDWVHPVTGLSVAAMLKARPQSEIDTVVPLA